MKTLTALQALKNLLQDMEDCGCINFYNEQDAIGVSGAVSDARQVLAAGDFDARNGNDDNAITPEFINAIHVYRSPDDVEMSLADQFKVIADRIEEDTP